MPFCLWMCVVGIKVEWALFDRLLVPPIVILILLPSVGLGIGIPMYVDSLEVNVSIPHLTMQLVFLLGTPFLLIGYRIGRGYIKGNWSPKSTENIFERERRPLIAVSWFFALFDILRITVGWVTGNLDRGYAGEISQVQGIGAWTIFSIFGRWNSLWFFFLPFLWRKGSLVVRLILVSALVYYCLISFASGSRGLILYPFIFLIVGVYFFVDKPKFRPERWIIALVLIFVSYIYAADVFRNTSTFQNSRLTNLSERLSASKEIVDGAIERKDFASTTGRALIGVSDELVYGFTPDPVPFAGGSDIIPAVVWTWVPQILAPNKPYLFDGDEIVISYTNNRQARSFSTISFSADLYRRFGWGFIPLGLLILGVVYGYFIRFVVFVYLNISVIAGVTLFAVIVGGLQTGVLSTVLTTWWIWAYDLPKHLVPLTLLVVFLGGGLGRGLVSHSRSR